MENLSVIITFIVYLAFMLAIGSHFYKRNESLSDYLIGGRGFFAGMGHGAI